ncbi:hypothetical protein HID58_090312, partial [Brassica napus]
SPSSTLLKSVLCLLITTFYSVIECLLSITSWFQIFLTSSRMEYSILVVVSDLIINILLNQLQLSYYHGFCIVAAHVLQAQPLGWKIALQMIYSLSAFWCYIASAIVASVKIVISALVVEPITSIRSLIVFFVFHGVIPLLKPSVVDIRGRLCNVSCLCIMIDSIFVFLLAFCCSKVVSQYDQKKKK